MTACMECGIVTAYVTMSPDDKGWLCEPCYVRRRERGIPRPLAGRFDEIVEDVVATVRPRMAPARNRDQAGGIAIGTMKTLVGWGGGLTGAACAWACGLAPILFVGCVCAGVGVGFVVARVVAVRMRG